MPMSPPHPCNQAGCGELVSRGVRYCEAHQREATKQYDKHHRPSYHALYHTTRWRAIRAAQLVEHPFCVECGQLADTVDHVVEHKGDPDSFFGGEVQSMCGGCHNRKHPRGWAVNSSVTYTYEPISQSHCRNRSCDPQKRPQLTVLSAAGRSSP